MIKKLIVISFLLTSSLLLSQNREEVINNWLDYKISHKSFIEITLEEIEGSTDLLELSKLYLNIGQAYYYLGDKDNSIKFLEKSKELAQDSLKERETSEGWRLVSDCGSYIMLQKGVSYIIKNSAKVQEQAVRALEIDGSNSRASLIDAQGLINAPKIFGGNKKKGIEILEIQSRRDDLNREDSFYIEMALAQAYKGSKNKEQALKAINRALKIFPGNEEAKKVLSQL